jgi:hypothetical protein
VYKALALDVCLVLSAFPRERHYAPRRATSRREVSTDKQLVVSAITLPLACRYLERIWSARELVRFVIVTIVGSNVIAFGFSWLTYLVLGQMDAFEGLPYHGLSGLQVGFLVAFTQLIPEHQVQLFGRLKVRVKVSAGWFFETVLASLALCRSLPILSCPYATA